MIIPYVFICEDKFQEVSLTLYEADSQINTGPVTIILISSSLGSITYIRIISNPLLTLPHYNNLIQ